MNKISKQLYVFYEILDFLEEQEKLKMQLVSKKFYNNIVPNCLKSCHIMSSKHVKKQESIFQYASGMLMHRDLDSICREAENGPQSQMRWNCLKPVNEAYQTENHLKK